MRHDCSKEKIGMVVPFFQVLLYSLFAFFLLCLLCYLLSVIVYFSSCCCCCFVEIKHWNRNEYLYTSTCQLMLSPFLWYSQVNHFIFSFYFIFFSFKERKDALHCRRKTLSWKDVCTRTRIVLVQIRSTSTSTGTSTRTETNLWNVRYSE